MISLKFINFYQISIFINKLKFKILLFLIIFSTLNLSCSKDEESLQDDSKVLLERISIKVSEIKGSKSLKLTANLFPSNATNKLLKWGLSDESIANLSSLGILNPLKYGSVKVTAKSTDGSEVFDEREFDFIPPTLVNSIEVDQYEITDGLPIQILASVLPTDAENKDLVWSISDSSIASIDQTGLLTPLKNGTVQITISSTDNSGVFRTIEVEISGVSTQKRTTLKAENILLWQRNNGGWPKEPHNSFTGYDRQQTPEEIQEAMNKKAFTDTTIDNNHTTGEVRILLEAYKNTNNIDYLVAAIKGVEYLFTAQYANGGWPQYYPLRNNYSRHITFNDNAMYNVMMLMKDIYTTQANTQYFPEAFQDAAKNSFFKGIEVIMNTQNFIDGVRTAWCAQHHASTLEPIKARDYELISNSGSESVGVVRVLMSVENPSQNIIEAVKAAVSWFDSVKLLNITTQRITDSSQPTGEDVIVVNSPGDVIWARFYDLETNQPFFCGRDGVKKSSLSEIDNERRTGYAWYGGWPKNLLNYEFQNWKEKNNIQ
ncbi:pectate lyase [Flavobacteriaceae bacterium]|nr:pectate lyase [Flavobacteriaceae bacterium]